MEYNCLELWMLCWCFCCCCLMFFVPTSAYFLFGNNTKVGDVIHVATSYIFDQNFGVCNDTRKYENS